MTNRTGLRVADDVCPGHFLGKFHMAPSERKVRRPVPSSTDAKALLTEADVPSLHLEPR